MNDLIDFLRMPICGNLKEVPGMTKELIKKLESDNIINTHNLFGKYLSYIGYEYNFKNYLKDLEIDIDEELIYNSIAEKANVMFPGTHSYE